MLFRKDIARSCAYCTYGVRLDGERILCSKKGLTAIGQQLPALSL